MTIKLHKLEAPKHFEAQQGRFSRLMQQAEALLLQGKGDRQACVRTLCEYSIDIACILLILGKPDDEVRNHVSDATRYALDWLHAPGSVGGPRVYEVNTEVSEEGVRVTSTHEKPPSRQPSKLPIDGFGKILSLTVAFNDRSYWSELGRFSEGGYRNPDEVAGAEYFGYLRALKAYIRGDESDAKREGLAALVGYEDTSYAKPGVLAFLALVNGDAVAFQKNIEARLVTHRKQYQKTPNDPMGIMCLHCMMLCRLALDRGISVEEGPYLPLRFLPNYPSVAKA